MPIIRRASTAGQKAEETCKSFFGTFCSGWMQALRDYSCILEELNRQLGE